MDSSTSDRFLGEPIGGRGRQPHRSWSPRQSATPRRTAAARMAREAGQAVAAESGFNTMVLHHDFLVADDPRRLRRERSLWAHVKTNTCPGDHVELLVVDDEGDECGGRGGSRHAMGHFDRGHRESDTTPQRVDYPRG